MKKHLAILLVLFFCSLSLKSQNTITGKVRDKNNKEPIPGASVLLLHPEDSTMLAFALSDDGGKFVIGDVQQAEYLLEISFLSYASAYRKIELRATRTTEDLGVILLEPVSETIQEITVLAEHIPMGVIGDTISYNAAAFRVRPGATTEDLLKKLPGIEVGRDGSIKAMGEDVKNVLVDGKEFFGNDPTIATRNIEAEAVDKVKVYDKKSEEAEFTEVDDGVKEKTIDIQLKEEYKSGGFGRIEGAVGTASRYEGKMNYNRFSPVMQASVILHANNVNKKAFSFREFNEFMGGISSFTSSSLSRLVSWGNNGNAPKGLANDLASGANFNYDLGSKLKLTSNYFFFRNENDVIENTSANLFDDKGEFGSRDSTASTINNIFHKLYFKLKYTPGKKSKIIWENTLSKGFDDQGVHAISDFFRDENLANRTVRDYRTARENTGYETQMIYRKKMDKKGRNFSIRGTLETGRALDTSMVYNTFLTSADIDQRQYYIARKDFFELKSSYTEPLGEDIFLTGSLQANNEKERPSKDFFDVVNAVPVLNEVLTATVTKKINSYKPRFSIRKNGEKYKINASMATQWTSIQVTSAAGENIINDVFNYLPRLTVDYDLTKSKSIDIGYHTDIGIPSLLQLAPLPDNSNPNSFLVGNPELLPTYTHRMHMRYRSVDRFNFKSFFANISYSVIKNKVINDITITQDLLRRIKPINTDHYNQLSGWFLFSRPIRPLKVKMSWNTQISGSAYEGVINSLKSDVQELNINTRFKIENRKKESIDIGAGIQFDHTNTRYAISPKLDTRFFNYSLFLDSDLFLGDFVLSSTFDYRRFNPSFFSEGRTISLWSASIEKTFNEGRLTLRLEANDLLNQNIGFTRFGTQTGLNTSRYNTLARYFMLGLKYKIGKKKEEKGMF